MNNGILAIDFYGKIVKKYEQIKEVEDDNFTRKLVDLCVKNKRHQHGGLIWMYEKDCTEENLHKKLNYKINSDKNKAIICIKDDIEEPFESLAEASRIKNLNYKCISKCINGHQKTHKGYTFRLIEEV